MVGMLPSEMALHIFRFLHHPRELATVALVSKGWHSYAYQGTLWKQLCITRWADKQYMHIEDIIRRERENALQRHDDASSSSSQEKRSENVLTKSGSTWIDWREKFRAAEVDSKREVITKEELCGVKWSFRFQHDMWTGENGHEFFPQFYLDGTYVHEGMQLHQTMSWRFIDLPRHSSDSDPSVPTKNVEGEEIIRMVQVQQFPPLTGNDIIIFH